MSGLFGMWRKDQLPLETNHITTLADKMQPWGITAPTYWRNQTVLLGHCQMDFTPEASHDTQPSFHPQHPTVRITADARLDNRAELAAKLGIPMHERTTTPDSMFILNAYLAWGTHCVDHLLGAFAFVIWDGRDQSLFCGRDPIGMRPLLYYDTPNIFVFASDIRALLAIDRVPEVVDEEMVVRHAMLDNHLVDRTFFHNIYNVPPAHRVSVTQHKTDCQRYWFPENTPRLHLKSNAAYAEQMRALLTEAVTCRLRSSAPIGAHLSGGLDSSAIAVLASRHLRQQAREIAALYSWSPPPTDMSGEQQLVAAVCQQEQLDCTYTDLTSADLQQMRDYDTLREPTAGYEEEMVVRRKVGAQQIGIMLSGWGGDEFASFNGRSCLAELFIRGRWRQLARELQSRKQQTGLGIYHNLYWQLFRPLMPDAFLRIRGYDIAGLHAYRQKQNRPITPLEDKIWRQKTLRLRDRASAKQKQLALLANGHLVKRIEAWAVKSAPHQFEYRYPLLDVRLITFCLSLPPEQYVQHGWSRFIFRQALEGILPTSVQWHTSKAEPSSSQRLAALSKQVYQNATPLPNLGIPST